MHKQRYTYAYVYKYTHMCMCVHTLFNMCIHMCIHMYEYIKKGVYMYTCIQIYTFDKGIHMHMYTNIRICPMSLMDLEVSAVEKASFRPRV